MSWQRKLWERQNPTLAQRRYGREISADRKQHFSLSRPLASEVPGLGSLLLRALNAESIDPAERITLRGSHDNAPAVSVLEQSNIAWAQNHGFRMLPEDMLEQLTEQAPSARHPLTARLLGCTVLGWRRDTNAAVALTFDTDTAATIRAEYETAMEVLNGERTRRAPTRHIVPHLTIARMGIRDGQSEQYICDAVQELLPELPEVTLQPVRTSNSSIMAESLAERSA